MGDSDELSALIHKDSSDISYLKESAELVPIPLQQKAVNKSSKVNNPPNRRQPIAEEHKTQNWKEELNSSVISLTIVSSISGFLCYYNTAVISGAMLQIQEDQRMNLSTVWTELIVSITVSLQ